MAFGLTNSERKIVLQTARETIRCRLFQEKPDYPDPTPALKQKCGAFVTLHQEGKLRGCIGYVRATKSLIETIKEVSASSAFDDPRFPPLQKLELSQIQIEASILSPLHRIKSVEEIEVGVHGILLNQGSCSGLLLPQVAAEYSWDREQFLTHTCYKAGLPGDCWKNNTTEIEVFSALVFHE